MRHESADGPAGRTRDRNQKVTGSTMIANDTDTRSCTSDSAGFHKYSLAPLIFPCCTRDGVVLLDLRRNRYLGLACRDALALSECVNGFPKVDQWTDSEAGVYAREPTKDLLASLLAGGIVNSSQARS